MTLSVAGIFKEIATILLSSSVFGDELTPINVTGLCIALTGIGLYNYLKYRLIMRNNFQHREDPLVSNEDGCNEMGSTALPSSGTREGNYTHLSGNGMHVEMDGDVVELTKDEIERRRRRDEEADMTGWNYSGTVRTGDGYDEGDGNSSDHTA
jgi:hypothetical protein